MSAVGSTFTGLLGSMFGSKDSAIKVVIIFTLGMLNIYVAEELFTCCCKGAHAKTWTFIGISIILSFLVPLGLWETSRFAYWRTLNKNLTDERTTLPVYICDNSSVPKKCMSEVAGIMKPCCICNKGYQKVIEQINLNEYEKPQPSDSEIIDRIMQILISYFGKGSDVYVRCKVANALWLSGEFKAISNSLMNRINQCRLITSLFIANHWVFLEIDFTRGKISVYDPMGQADSCKEAIKEHFRKFCHHCNTQECDWEDVPTHPIVEHLSGGKNLVLLLKLAENRLRGLNCNFSSDVESCKQYRAYFRKIYINNRDTCCYVYHGCKDCTNLVWALFTTCIWCMILLFDGDYFACVSTSKPYGEFNCSDFQPSNRPPYSAEYESHKQNCQDVGLVVGLVVIVILLFLKFCCYACCCCRDSGGDDNLFNNDQSGNKERNNDKPGDNQPKDEETDIDCRCTISLLYSAELAGESNRGA